MYIYIYILNPQENNNAEAQPQQRCFATLSKSHPHTDMPLKIHSIFAEHRPLGEHLSGGLLLHVKRILKDLNYKKILFTVVKTAC